MEGFWQTIPGIVLTIGGVLSIVVMGGLFVAGLWKKGKDDEGARLVGILKETVDALETKVNDQKKEVDIQKKESDQIVFDLTKKIDDLTVKVDHLEKENSTLTKVLQGRDEQTQSFYKKAFEAMEVSTKTHALVEAMSKTQTELMKVLAEHLKPGVVVNNQTK